MEPTSSSLVAEAMAMWTAVQQFHGLCYTKVAFLGDCLKLMKILQGRAEGKQIQGAGSPEVINIVQDIREVATTNNFNFCHVPRNLIHVVDKLAKKARLYDRSYIISRLNYCI